MTELNDPSTVEAAHAAEALRITRAYHARSKHQPSRYAASLGYLDWATQPDPFRRFHGAALIPLELLQPEPEPCYESAFQLRQARAAALDHRAISQFFQDSYALSAWKQSGANRWALRVNPSSGNLHPTEAYLIADAVPGLSASPAVYHYAPHEHALERRAELPTQAWQTLASQLPHGAFIIGLSSIYWRESWKYGERAFRYCQHDVGHAIAAAAIAAAGLGWETCLLESLADADIAALLGLTDQTGPEAEHADCLIAVFPQQATASEHPFQMLRFAESLRETLKGTTWQGTANTLSADHHDWPVIETVAAATEKTQMPDPDIWSGLTFENTALTYGDSALPLRRIIQQRRSAVAMDGRSAITREAWYQILLKCMPGRRQLPHSTLPWSPCVDLLLFVHRVMDVTPGLYVLLRDPHRQPRLMQAMKTELTWQQPEGCPLSLPLYCLQEGDARTLAQQLSCHQEIAADGVFAVALLADYRAALERYGAWFYRRLYWEAGLIGQLLYLEAEASGIRGTGIGCYFDDPTHQLFGLSDDRFQVLYDFTLGGPVEDSRLQTYPAYTHLQRAQATKPM